MLCIVDSYAFVSTVIHNCQKLCFLAHLVTSTPSDSFGEVPRDQCCNGTKRGGSLPGDRPPGVEAGTYRGPDVMLAWCLKLKQRNPVSRVTVCWNVFEYVPWCFTKIDTDSLCSLCFFRRILPAQGLVPVKKVQARRTHLIWMWDFPLIWMRNPVYM